MHLGTLDSAPPSFFRQGVSALSKLFVFSAMALFLMVADTRFDMTRPIRLAIAGALYPLQTVVVLPARWIGDAVRYFESLRTALLAEEAARQQLAQQSMRAGQVEQLTLENTRLRLLLQLRETIKTPAQAAQVLYDAADPYRRQVIIDKGLVHGVVAGSPVLDEAGALGQVTRVYPSTSEVTLVSDPDQAIPVLNTRTGTRAVAFGDPDVDTGALELRFMPSNADVQAGDLLTTSGVDGVYPAGLQVARVDRVERRVDSAFARIYCTPVAKVAGAFHVMVLQPVPGQAPKHAEPEAPAAHEKKGKSK